MDNTQENINYQQGLRDSRKSKQTNNHGQKLSKAQRKNAEPRHINEQLLSNFHRINHSYTINAVQKHRDGEGNGNPLKCSCLEKSMDRGAWRVT